MSGERTTAEKDSSGRTHSSETSTLETAPVEEQGPLLVSRSPRNGATGAATAYLSRRDTLAQHSVVLRAIQQTRGNRFAQRVIAQLRANAQRQCQCGGTCDSCKGQTEPAPSPTDSQILVQPRAQGEPDEGTVSAATLQPATSSGRPLDQDTRRSMESQFGSRFEGVRVHTGEPASKAAEAIQADAYTIGKDIYFGESKYQPESQEGRKLLAHELTHVVQQGEGKSPSEAMVSASGEVAIGSPNDPLEKEAESQADSVSRDEQSGEISQDGSGSVRRREWTLTDNPLVNTASAGAELVSSGAGAVASGVKSGLNKGKQFVIAQIEKYAPGVIRFFQNIKTYFKDLLSKAADGLFGGLLSSIREKGLAGTLAELIGKFASGALSVVGGFVAGQCAVIGALAGYLLDLQMKLGAAAFAEVKKGFEAASSALGGVWDDYAAPAIDVIKKKLKSAWKTVEDKVSQFWEWLKPLRETVGTIWNEVTDFLIEGKRSFDGWMDALIPKALDAWEKIKGDLKPFMEKVKAAAKVVGVVLLLMPPHGPFVIAAAAIYGLYLGVKALWDKWGKGFTASVRKWWVNEALPQVQGGIKAFKATVDAAGATIKGILEKIGDAVLSVIEALGVLSFLSSVKATLDSFSKKVTAFKDSLSKTLDEWAGKIKDLAVKAEPYFQKLKEALRQTLLVSLVGPFAVLDDGVWSTVQKVTKIIMATPCLRELGGLVRLPAVLVKIGQLRKNIKAGWEVIKNPGPLLAALRDAIAPMIAKIEPAIHANLTASLSERELHIQLLILHYLAESLSELRTGWWEQLKKLGGDLLWPWDEVSKEFMPMLEDFGAAVGAVFDLEFNTAADKFFSGMKRFNTIAGALSGWFLLASVLIGAVLGALGFVTGPGGVGTVGIGASAGLAFAESVGIGLLILALTTEGLAMEKALFDLRHQNTRIANQELRDIEDATDAKAIAGSLLGIVTIGALLLLGAIAQKFASFLMGLVQKVPIIRDIAAFLKNAKQKAADFSLVDQPGGGAAGKGGKPGARDVVPDPDTTAKPGDFTPEQLETAKKNLGERVNDPKNVREVTDPALKDKYDVEVDLGDGQTYRRKKDGTWCLFRNPTDCGHSAPPEVNAAADAQKAKADAEGAGERPAADTLTEAQKAKLEAELNDLKTRQTDLKARVDELQARFDAQKRLADDLSNKSTAARGDERVRLQQRASKEYQKLDRIKAHLNEAKGQLRTVNEDLGRVKTNLDEGAKTTLPCFAAGTLVLTSDGPRPIETIVAGTSVVAFDTVQNVVVSRRVTEVHRNWTRHLYRIVVADSEILATGRHPFWSVKDARWIAAKELHEGSTLLAVSGSATPVQRIQREEISHAATYNLEIEETHNYFVGPGILVHNGGPARYNFGKISIYEGINPNFPNQVYIGQTNDLVGRERDHRSLARRKLQDPNLSAAEREFYDFMKDVELRERVGGLNADQANFMEQTNKTIEERIRGEDNVMNRREQVKDVNMPELREKIKEQLKQAGGGCPE